MQIHQLIDLELEFFWDNFFSEIRFRNGVQHQKLYILDAQLIFIVVL